MKRLMTGAVALMVCAAAVLAQEKAAATTTNAVQKTATAPVTGKTEKENPPELVEKEDGEKNLISSETSLDFLSAYVWRGQICCDEPVWQPSETLSLNMKDYGSLNANVWGSFYVNDNKKPRQYAGLHEVDLAASYTKSFDALDLDLGHVWYTFPHQAKQGVHTTSEFYAGTAYNNDYITPSAYIYWDYSDNGGNDTDAVYAEFMFSHEFELTDKLSLELASGFGVADAAYMRYYSDVNSAEFNDFQSRIGTSYALTDHISVGASLTYYYELSHTVRHSDYDCRDDYNQILVGGVNLTASF